MNGLQRKLSSSIVLLLLSLNAAFTPGPNQACLGSVKKLLSHVGGWLDSSI